MELVYSLEFKGVPKASEIVENKICCSLSSKNILAFSRIGNGKGNDNKSQEPQNHNERDRLDLSHELCVIDLDKPWREYRVTTSHAPITNIKWDPSGMALLFVDTEGCYSLWKMKDHLLNVWEEAGKMEVQNEDILVLSWLHYGIQTLFNPETTASLYNEKFSFAKMCPSVSQFGKKPVEGWIAVTSTGMVLVGLIPNSTGPIVVGKASLNHTPSHIAAADVAFMSDGHIMIAVSDGHIGSSIHCHMVSLSLRNNTCVIKCQTSASFFLKKQMSEGGIPDHMTPRLTHLSFMNRESGDVLLAGWGTSTYSCVEVWHLVEQTVPLHRLFQNTGVSEFAFKTPRWLHKSSFSYRSSLTNIARPKLPISRSFNMESTNFLCYFVATYRDGTVKVIHRQSYQVILTFTLDQLLNPKHEPVEKRSRTGNNPYFVSAVQTNTGCGLVGLADSRLVLLRTFSAPPLQMLPTYVVLLLEYTMFTGLDAWDVLLAVRQGMIEGVIDKLNSNFQKQTGAFQDLLQQRLLRLKMGLYSSKIPKGYNDLHYNIPATDCRAMITLHAIGNLLKSRLRPKSVTAQDKSPSEKLASQCTLNPDDNIDQMIKILEPDDLMRDNFRSSTTQSGHPSLQSLQPFIQWVADFILHVLAGVSMFPNNPGSLLLKDTQALSLMREVLVIIRAWGKVSPACLPHFMMTQSHDPLPLLFSLVTKAWIDARDSSSNVETDKAFMEECCNLPSKMLLPNYRKSFGEEMNCYLLFTQQNPMIFEFGIEPEIFSRWRSPHRMFPLDLCLEEGQKYDCVRHMMLGMRPREPVRECVRCRSLSLRRSPNKTKSQVLKAWELQYVKSCPCGGHWSLQVPTATKS